MERQLMQARCEIKSTLKIVLMREREEERDSPFQAVMGRGN